MDAVFNLELPSNAAHYAHRAGRTGRMGAPGVVVSIAAPSERFVIDRLAQRLGVPILVGVGFCDELPAEAGGSWAKPGTRSSRSACAQQSG